MAAGYSGTLLVKKLGIKEGFSVAFPGAPEGFEAELGPLPGGLRIKKQARSPLDLVLYFTRRRSELRRRVAKLAAALEPDGSLWIAWPKKASGVETDLSFDVVQRIGLEAGLVDIKICAVNEIWSGLKFVYRKEDRPKLAR